MTMDKRVIRWKLNEIMAQKRVRNKDLAEGIGITETSVYRLRKTDTMPRMSPERLNDICQFLDCQPGDLLIYIPDNDAEMAEKNQQKLSKRIATTKHQLPETDEEVTEDIAA
ncbi:helix-turn-helix transcriptional regulator [Nostoc sp. UHCC 0251]|uniref:helix-turn-helix domain-containing protein n=2 Tax=unclassified Nostoc TaxID=2593658 RepID=UPI002B1F94AA|nr:helix-turn-helix transcriptional regulator [Nostoc sp. UHCC 0251]MEA5628105.1 helix-turn-helix transcriptional regulator [Nostoc sp. UHCC 0251]